MAGHNCERGPQPVGGENRNVYTSGTLLETVQRSNMFPDCKTFVDMKMRYPPDRILADFQLFSNCRRNDGSLYFLQMFVDKHFEPKGTEMENCTPIDWKAEPPFVNQICDIELKQFAYKLNELWKQLCWRLNDDVQQNPELYSSIYVPNPFIIPGGKFIEYYYWDSYWIVIGLLLGGMRETAKGIINNFLHLIRQYGVIPSGGRVYYYGRSHPPLLIHMMKAYVDATRDEKFAIESLPLLETEFKNFLDNHSVEVQDRIMYQYRDHSLGPRPESFREDIASAGCLCPETQKDEFYAELKAACESGMNFSSRWFITPQGTNEGTLSNTKTRSIVPVDLNAILFRNCKTLAYFYNQAGNTAKAEEYQDLACDMAKSIRDILWNDEAGIWLDYDLENDKPRPYFCVSNFFPLWTRAFPIVDREKIAQGVMAYIKSNNLDSYSGGVPFTLNRSGLQWDYPNVWPCMMYVLIEGLDNLGTPESKALSKRWGHRWIKSNYNSFKTDGHMFEKYDCETFGSSGGCGQYEKETGYGWTNGVAIYFLSKYCRDLSLADTSDGSGQSQSSKDKKDCIITSDVQVAHKKQKEIIVTSDAYMNKATKDPCECEGSKDESVYHTPKSDEEHGNGNNDMMNQCLSEKSEFECPPCGASDDNEKAAERVKTPVQVCQYCGKIIGDQSARQSINQQQPMCSPHADVPMQQKQESVCPCQSEAAALMQQQQPNQQQQKPLQQDKSTSPFQQQQPSGHDKSTCPCPDDEVEVEPHVPAHHKQEEEELKCPAACSAAESQPGPIETRLFPLSDPKSMGFGLCSDDEVFKPKPAKSKEKECP